ncbi:bifunctional dihydrofolate reductase-thymidylate synthase [Cannabis sativa]|uniref:bifunctional dihydrofolate reductase-thymidylate synthase n=1 Tax=Cannabis sativa TaxID=3483 RepID=UPI0029CA76D9|nr:bifunctional dihydrofolate reductase-thymidylate synthase [Cannabis sativa]XP_060969216.1 bifunctional dihydrofolate reductase-thymidylate synthase [Cannabis sativa]
MFRFSLHRSLKPHPQIRLPIFDSVHASSSPLFGVLKGVLKFPVRSSFSGQEGDGGDCQRRYQVVVAATTNMGIGKNGKLPWKLPSDLKFFKELTTTTLDPTKENAVIMGRKTWESIPLQFRPLPARLNVILTRSGSVDDDDDDDDSISEKVVVFESISSALKMLAQSPYSQSIERVFIIGGGQVLSEALNSPECDAIHITKIETSIDCDTFIPSIDLSLFKLWYSSQPLVENNIQFSFATYVRVRSSRISQKLQAESFRFLPKMIFERLDEHLVQEITSSDSQKDD